MDPSQEPQPKRTLLQKFFGRGGPKFKAPENIPNINVKGEKVFSAKGKSRSFEPEVSQGALERQLFANEKGPRMLPRNKRLKVWLALLGIGTWFFGCFCLVAYRLKSDDLELMEREVYEELRLKKEVQRYQDKQRLSGSSASDMMPIGETAIPKL